MLVRGLLVGGMLTVGAFAGLAEEAKANIPFEFRTPAGVMPSGQYKLEVRSFHGGSKYIQLRDAETMRSVVFYTESPIYTNRFDAKPHLRFLCGQAGCSLRELWASGMQGYNIRQPKMTPAETERLTEIRVPLKSSNPAE
jgi:hypothetical protein